MDCIKLASSTMNGNCKTVISTSAKLMCSASPFHCVPQENHRSMLFRAEKHNVMALLTCLGVFQQWYSFPPLFWSHSHSSNPVWSNLYAHNPAPPDRSLDVQANVVEQFLLCVASRVKNGSTNNPRVFMRVWMGTYVKLLRWDTARAYSKLSPNAIHSFRKRRVLYRLLGLRRSASYGSFTLLGGK